MNEAKQFLKRRLAIFLAVLQVLMVFAAVPVMALDEETETNSDFVIEDGVLISYQGNGGEVTIPAGVTAIGNRAFFYCQNLIDISIPDSVTSIGDEAFYYCESLERVTVPASVTVIGDNVFNLCYSLTEITVNENNPNYCSESGVLFNKNKTSLVCCPGGKSGAYTIPNSVTSIGKRAFYGCQSLIDISIPNSVTSIGERAFHGCRSLERISIPSSVVEVAEDVFFGCDSLADIAVAAGNPNYCTEEGVLFDKGKTTLLKCSCDKSGVYTVPDGVTHITAGAFYNCRSLTGVAIPEGVTVIGSNAFESCYNLERVSLPSSIISIGIYAFAYCSSLEGIVIPDGVVAVEEGTFYGCRSLKNVVIPDSVTSIGGVAFHTCESLEEISIPNGVTELTYYAFYGCRSLKSVVIPDSVTAITDWAFSECSNLESVIIPASVTHFQRVPFSGRDNMIIKGYTNSKAETYAHKSGFSFISIGTITLPTIMAKVTQSENGIDTVISGSFRPTESPGENVSAENGAIVIQAGTGKQNAIERASVVLGQHTVDSLANPGAVKSVTIKTDVADVTFDAVALQNIAAAEDDVTLNMRVSKSNVSNAEEKCVVSISLSYNGAFFTEYLLKEGTSSTNGTITVMVPYEKQDSSSVVQVYYHGTKSLEPVSASYDTKSKTVTFTTSHLSNYGIWEKPHTHSPQTVAAVAPTCTKEGSTEGVKCTMCGQWLTEPETIPATGHQRNDGEITKQPDVGRKGEKTYTCTVCGETSTEEIPALVSKASFEDVQDTGSWYYNAVQWAAAKGVTTGKTETIFAPNDNCTRAQAVTFLWRAEGSPQPSSTSTAFTDIVPGAYYYDAVLWAVEKGITTGTDDTHFSPDGEVTRGQMVTFLWRMHKKPAAANSTFTDVPESAYYYNAVSWAVSQGITNGTDEAANTFEPETTCTRAHIVTFLYRDQVG